MTVGAILTQGLGSPFGGPSLMITLGYLAGEALPEVVVSGALGGGGYVDPPGWRTRKKKDLHARERKEREERGDRKPVNVEALFTPPAFDLREMPLKPVPLRIGEQLLSADVNHITITPFSVIKPRAVVQTFGDEDELLLILAMEI